MSQPDHIVVVIEENHDADQIIGNPNAPYINGTLVANGLYYTNAHGTDHPSQPNYLEMFAGANPGVPGVNSPLQQHYPSGTENTPASQDALNNGDNYNTAQPFSAPNLGAELLAGGKSFAGYSEDLPSVGFTGASANGINGNRSYVEKHNAWAQFQGNGPNQLPADTNQPFTAFKMTSDFSKLPNVSFVVPNEYNDMHDTVSKTGLYAVGQTGLDKNGNPVNDDTTIQNGDSWLSNNIEAYRQWATTHNSLLITVWDENDYDFTNANNIPMVIDGDPRLVQTGVNSSYVNHFDLLKTLEGDYGLALTGAAATANGLSTNHDGKLLADPAVINFEPNGPSTIVVGPSAVSNSADHGLPIVVSGFQIGDKIDLAGVKTAASAHLNSQNVLTVVDHNGTTLASLKLSGDYSGLTFHLASDGHGGTDLSLVNPKIGPIRTFTPTGDTAPDSLTLADHSLFAAYANGVASDGTSNKTSEIVQYDLSGHIVHTYDIAGSVDGLKYNPTTETLWALQNQDGNSKLTIIDPETHHVSKPLSYDDTSASRGYDDVVFQNGKTFLSYTNPVNKGDAVIVSLEGGSHPKGELETNPVLKFGATGTNTVTHASNQIVPLNDPDSLKAAPNGNLLLSSGSDGTIVDVRHAGKADQSVSFTQISDGKGGHAIGLDDVIKTNATSGTFYLADTKSNSVESFHVTGLNTNDYYASVADLGGFGRVDPATGKFTLLVAAPGAHGIAFTPDADGHTADHPHPSVDDNSLGAELLNEQHKGVDPAALHLHDGHWFA